MRKEFKVKLFGCGRTGLVAGTPLRISPFDYAQDRLCGLPQDGSS